MASNTGCTSVGEPLMTCRISAVAVCCSSASFVSLNSRAFWIAITAWSAKVCSSASSLSVKAPAARAPTPTARRCLGPPTASARTPSMRMPTSLRHVSRTPAGSRAVRRGRASAARAVDASRGPEACATAAREELRARRANAAPRRRPIMQHAVAVAAAATPSRRRLPNRRWPAVAGSRRTPAARRRASSLMTRSTSAVARLPLQRLLASR